jgi:CopZ-like zinc binding protein
MNKAFVREPEDDGRAYCPRCRSLGRPVEKGPLDTHISPDARHKMQDAAWYCGFPRCDVAYFNLYGNVVTIDELNSPLYPYDPNAPMCACFGLTYDDVEADVREGTPIRIRDVVARSKTDEARCHMLAADGCSCLGAVQELYMRLRSQAAEG